MVQQSYPFATPPSTQNPEGVVNTDEKYRAMARWWREDGVVDGYLDELAVTYVNFTATIRPGAAFVNGTYYVNTAPVTVPLPALAAGSSRIDRVVVRLDMTAKTATIAVRPGVAGVNAPSALVRNATTWETLLDQVLVIGGASGAFNALGQRYDRWSYGDRRSGRPPGWHVSLASGTLLPRGQGVRIGITADNEQGHFAEGVRVTFGASSSGITIDRDGLYDVAIQGRIEPEAADSTVAPETVYAEHQRIIGGQWTRIARVGGPDGAVSSSGFLNCLAGDAVVPYAYQLHATGTWRLTNRLNESLFSGVWRRDYGGA